MNSIDNLREYVTKQAHINEVVKSCVIAYIDGIEREVDERYVPLPVDADGEPIHIGDVMEWVSDDEDYKPVIRTVDAVGEQSFFAWGKESGRYAQYEARAYRHHRAPTVEDVLREFVERLDEIGSEDDCGGVEEQECRACIRRDIAAAYAEYAAKLRLAGDDA